MTPDAAGRDDEQVSTQADDPRLLRIGGFMRRWNLDEAAASSERAPREMSLMRPAPKRPIMSTVAGAIRIISRDTSSSRA